MLCFAASTAGVVGAESLDAVEKSASEWVKLRLETTRLETDWRMERGLLETMVHATQERATALEEQRDLAKAKTARDREELDAMRAKNAAAQDDLHAAESRLKALTQRLATLRPALPPRLSDALEMSFRSLANDELPLGERMQLTTTVLNRCAQFNRLVSTGEDVLTLEGEPTAKSFETIYWGLSHGYAIDRATSRAWLGAPDNGVWKWQSRPDAFEPVTQLIAVATDKADPDFVSVPATVSRLVSTTSNNQAP